MQQPMTDFDDAKAKPPTPRWANKPDYTIVPLKIEGFRTNKPLEFAKYSPVVTLKTRRIASKRKSKENRHFSLIASSETLVPRLPPGNALLSRLRLALPHIQFNMSLHQSRRNLQFVGFQGRAAEPVSAISENCQRKTAGIYSIRPLAFLAITLAN